MHFQPSLVQSFVLIFKMKSYFGEVVQNFELKRVGGAPKGHQLTPLMKKQFSSKKGNSKFDVSSLSSLSCYSCMVSTDKQQSYPDKAQPYG